MADHQLNPQISPFAAAVTCKCPRCGRAPLFAAWWSLNLGKECTACHLDYAFIDSGDGPAVFAIFLLGFIALGGALLMHLSFGVPLWITYVFWGIATPLIALGLLRFLKALLVALQLKNKAEEGRLSE